MQWLIDIAIAAMKAWFALYGGFHDRGDPAVYDFTITDFIRDSGWHELDLSGIVPAGVKAVYLRALIKNTGVGKRVEFRKHSNVNTVNKIQRWTHVANINSSVGEACAVDADRKIDYYATTGGWVTLNVAVKGWWF